MAGDVTVLLGKLRQGEAGAADQLFSMLYTELRSLAAGLFRSQRASHTLQPTAVLHEAYLKMVKAPGEWKDRAHFFAVAAKAMRQVLVNHARDQAALKRGGKNAERVTLEGLPAGAPGEAAEILALHDALEELAKLDARQARIAELKFFAGLSTEEVAEAVGIATRTVELDWKMAKDWLSARLRAE